MALKALPNDMERGLQELNIEVNDANSRASEDTTQKNRNPQNHQTSNGAAQPVLWQQTKKPYGENPASLSKGTPDKQNPYGQTIA